MEAIRSADEHRIDALLADQLIEVLAVPGDRVSRRDLLGSLREYVLSRDNLQTG
jgi:hypothetical protein